MHFWLSPSDWKQHARLYFVIIDSYTLVLLRRALISGVLLWSGLVDLVDSTPPADDTQTPELSKT